MGQLKLKSLSFYGIAIGSVMILFKIVSTYGDANLASKTPDAIGGRYPIKSSNLPPCLGNKALTLNISQSGIYLNGSLFTSGFSAAKIASEAEGVNSEGKPTLSGKLKNQVFSLTGKVNKLGQCDSNQGKSLVKIEGIIQDKKLTGKIKFNDNQAVNFVSMRDHKSVETKTH